MAGAAEMLPVADVINFDVASGVIRLRSRLRHIVHIAY